MSHLCSSFQPADFAWAPTKFCKWRLGVRSQMSTNRIYQNSPTEYEGRLDSSSRNYHNQRYMPTVCSSYMCKHAYCVHHYEEALDFPDECLMLGPLVFYATNDAVQQSTHSTHSVWKTLAVNINPTSTPHNASASAGGQPL